jgi:protein-S-isoprenylcysteine O-methyltransferase Ste14
MHVRPACAALLASLRMSAPAGEVTRKAFVGLLELVVVLGLLIFVPAGTMRFVQGWIFLALFAGSSLAITAYLVKNDPALLERRTHGGPAAEKETTQKVIQVFASLAFLSTIVVPALEHRFHGPSVTPAVTGVGDLLVALGFAIVFFVFRENTFTSARIEVAAEQRVIDSGPYAVVRHPMYVGGLVLVAGIPLALGSWIGLASLAPFAAVIAWRLLDEERFLSTHLPGYPEYCAKTRYRLIPYVW